MVKPHTGREIHGIERETMTGQSHASTPRRRAYPRFPGPFPVRARGIDADGQVFVAHAQADDISQGGVYLRLPGAVEPGARIFTLARLPGGATVAARGRVLRAEAKPHGFSGVAVCFSRVRLLPGRAA